MNRFDRFLISFLALAFLQFTLQPTGGLDAGLWAGEEGEEAIEFDTIRRNDNKKVPPTKIVTEDYLYVVGKLRNVKTKVPSYAVAEVHRADADMSFTTALEKRRNDKNLTAARYFRIALQSMASKKWAQEYCNYYIGDSFMRAGRFSGYTDKKNYTYKPAAHYFQEAINVNPKSRFLLDAMVKKAMCLAEAGKLEAADKAFKEAESRIKAYRSEVMHVDPQYLNEANRARAQLEMGRATFLEKKADEKGEGGDYNPALRAFKSAQTLSSGKFKEVYANAVDGEMRVLLAMEDYGAARDRAENIIEKFKQKADPELFPMLPGAHTVMGVANFKQAIDYLKNGQQLQAQNKFAEARWSFLHVVVQFFDNEEYVAKAHFFSGLCYEKLKEQETGGVEKALRHWKTIVDDYPRSKFADPAKEKIASVGPTPAAPEPEKEEKKDEKTAPKKEAPKKKGGAKKKK